MVKRSAFHLLFLGNPIKKSCCVSGWLMSHDITLDELVRCTKQGYMLVAESAVDGRRVHIDDTVSGLACACICPGCGRQMVARKGKINTHSFAHHREEDGIDCRSAGETALHKFAKEVLAQSLQLRLPPVTVRDENGPLLVSKEMVLNFDTAILEKRDGEVIPDVICILQGRRLHVEFKVTHPCGEDKIEKLIAMDVGSIEIDLSEYRYVPLRNLKRIILHKAKRRWLHTRMYEKGIKQLEKRASLIEAEQVKTAEKLAALCVSLPKSMNTEVGPFEQKAATYGLKEIIGGDLDHSCFTVRWQEWKAFLLFEINKRQIPFEPDTLFKRLVSLNYVQREFAELDYDMRQRLKILMPEFIGPRDAYDDYLNYLTKSRLLVREGSKYGKSSKLAHVIKKAETSSILPSSRRSEIYGVVQSALSHVHQDVIENFDFDMWLDEFARANSLSVDAFLRVGDEVWFHALGGLRRLKAALSGVPFECDTLGLPVDETLAEKIATERERRRLKDVELREFERRKAEKRAKDFQRLVLREFGDVGLDWALSPKDWLNGATPMEAAQMSTQGEDKVRAVVFANIERRRKQAEKAREKEIALEKLKVETRKLLPSNEHVDLWLRQSFKKIDGLKPIDYCIDNNTLDRCLKILTEGDNVWP